MGLCAHGHLIPGCTASTRLGAIQGPPTRLMTLNSEVVTSMRVGGVHRLQMLVLNPKVLSFEGAAGPCTPARLQHSVPLGVASAVGNCCRAEGPPIFYSLGQAG